MPRKIHTIPCRDRHFQAVPAFYTNFEVARVQVRRLPLFLANPSHMAHPQDGSQLYASWAEVTRRA